MQNKIIHILELVWLSLAIISFLAGLYNFYKLGLQESLMFFAITFIALMMYFYRRHLRRSQNP